MKMFQIKGWHIFMVYHSLQIVGNYSVWTHEVHVKMPPSKLKTRSLLEQNVGLLHLKADRSEF